ncbi:MAG: triose-phosphate isomerase [Planctomycetaceae bacterium]|nr:triose-phosphate isomerase [Planctomycetaceae bacterium]
MRRYLISGNWKMNTTRATGVELVKALAAGCEGDESVDVLVFPPAPYLIPILDAVKGTSIQVGAQNAYFEEPGAYTGEVGLEMLQDIGCETLLVGHSERRHVFGETDELLNRKVKVALDKGFRVVLCVGELLSERQDDRTNEVLDTQMAGGLQDVTAEQLGQVVIAYEPVWAIGTGHTASPEQADAAHANIRGWLATNYSADAAEAMQILYGGSVKADNAAELLGQPNVDGALVGGASLKASAFLPIIQAGIAATKG